MMPLTNREKYGKFITYSDKYVIIADVDWWLLNEPEIFEWLENNTVKGVECHKGLTLTFDNGEEMMWFKLRWE